MHDTQATIKGQGSTVILLHGRGGSAQDMMAFANHHLPPARYVALQADDNRWYPNTFLAPREDNQPYLDAALAAVTRAIGDESRNTIVILGFSQGACLAQEYAARNPAKYRGIISFSGGLIGESITPPSSTLEGTPVIISGSEDDPFIPLARMRKSAQVLEDAGAQVTVKTYPGNTHTIMPDELSLASKIISGS